ncbi:MAG: type II toxin-antitoxin system RelE/ParE family toxin [Phycisphaerae bacterium]
MTAFVLTPAAEADLTDIISYIAGHNSAAAEKTVDRFGRTFRMLADNPEAGHLREDLANEPLRFWTIYSYMIIYRPGTSPLQIIRILHGAQDLKEMLDSGE